jgi:hypothetical protein
MRSMQKLDCDAEIKMEAKELQNEGRLLEFEVQLAGACAYVGCYEFPFFVFLFAFSIFHFTFICNFSYNILCIEYL